MSWETLLCFTVAAIVITLALDHWYPRFLKEGFMVGVGENPFLTGYFPRRGDISFESEETGYRQDPRHVMGYADVQGLGANHDFCRMIQPADATDESGMFFACALAGTENLASTTYRTQSVAQGFKMSRDDYMRDADKDGKTDYCAVIKSPRNSTWEPRCYRALSTTFDTRTVVDVDPPEDISDIVLFYEGIMFWFRFIDDMKDYAENVKVYTSGGITIDETPNLLSSQRPQTERSERPERLQGTTSLDDRIQTTEGVHFNGDNEFIRLGDSPDMGFGKKITLTTMRAMCFWVYFDEFTNNAHIVDFGNGAGQDNVFVGIVGRGDESVTGEILEKENCVCLSPSTLPDAPSGAQPVPSMTPQELMMLSTPSLCQTVLPRNLPPLKPLQARTTAIGRTATLVYEIWNGKLRLQHMTVQKAIPLKKWTHVCITTATSDGVRPTVDIWIDGLKKASNPNGYLPQSSFTSNNYLGKSNWVNSSSMYENKAELFKGSLFDLRGYNQLVTEATLKKTLKWGRQRLGLANDLV